jgi:hypothetical protein
MIRGWCGCFDQDPVIEIYGWPMLARVRGEGEQVRLFKIRVHDATLKTSTSRERYRWQFVALMTAPDELWRTEGQWGSARSENDVSNI